MFSWYFSAMQSMLFAAVYLLFVIAKNETPDTLDGIVIGASVALALLFLRKGGKVEESGENDVVITIEGSEFDEKTHGERDDD